MRGMGRLKWTSLGLMGTLVLLAFRSPASGQESAGREMTRAESQALESWARGLLQEVSESGQLTEPGSGSGALQRLWALYFLSVDHRSRVDDARATAAELQKETLRSDSAATVRALSAAVEVVRAKHSRWPPNKLKYLRNGMEALDALIQEYPEEPSVRYLRLVSYYYLPFFLDREEAVGEDLTVLSQLLPRGPGAMPAPIYMAAVEFLLEKGEHTEETRTLLKGLLE
jgi:hypothetical protein